MTTPPPYKRNISFKSVFYKILFFLNLISILITLVNKKHDYSILLFILYIFIETFLSPKGLEIGNSKLTISRKYFGGLLKKTQTIHITKIKSIRSIGLDISNDSGAEEGSGFIWWIKERSEKPFDLYQFEYLDEQNKIRKIKLHMHSNECNMMQNMHTFPSSNLEKTFFKEDQIK